MKSHLGLMDNSRTIQLSKTTFLPVICASQDVANVIMIIINAKVDLAIL